MNTPTNDGGPAFARSSSEHPMRDEWHPAQRGMTLRDYFAAQILAVASEDYSPAEAAQISYEYADALIAERQKFYERNCNGLSE